MTVPALAPAAAGARPTRPCLTPAIRSALRWSVSWRYPAIGDPIPVLAPNWQPPPLEPAQLAAAKTAIAGLEAHLAPVAKSDARWLGRRVSAWLAHAFVPEMDDAALAMVVSDWAERLRRFPRWAIAEAAKEEIGSGRRCSLDGAVAACTRLVANAAAELAALKRLVDPLEQERAARRLAQQLADEQREAEKQARLAANPGWSPLSDALRRAIEAHPEIESPLRAAIDIADRTESTATEEVNR